MSKKKTLTAFQLKLLTIIEEALSKEDDNTKDHFGFDFPCLNDHCSGKNGVRHIGFAWKITKKKYKTFCDVCGQEEYLDRESFKEKKREIDKETALYNMQLEKEKKQAKCENE